MTTTLKIVHTTGYEYSAPVTDSFNEIRMSPRYSPEQLIREREVSITPSPWSYHYIDYWGSQVTAFEIHEPHQRMSVTVSTLLDVSRDEQPTTDLKLADISQFADRWNEYLVLTPSVKPHDDLAKKAEEIASQHENVDEIAREIAGYVHDSMEYDPDATDVNSIATQAWQDRKGVCQDFANVTIGALRHIGIPARYVSGYVMPTTDAPIGTEVTGESHAWVQWWDGAWYGFDPTNDVVPGELHVQVGLGRDYQDVAPLTGMFLGQSESTIFVEVKITQIR